MWKQELGGLQAAKHSMQSDFCQSAWSTKSYLESGLRLDPLRRPLSAPQSSYLDFSGKDMEEMDWANGWDGQTGSGEVEDGGDGIGVWMKKELGRRKEEGRLMWEGSWLPPPPPQKDDTCSPS